MDRRRDGFVRGVNGSKAGWDSPGCEWMKAGWYYPACEWRKAGWVCPGCEWIEGGMGLSGVRMDRRRDGIVWRVNG